MKLLMVIDMQNDFANEETGSLVVEGSQKLIDGINQKIEYYKNTGNKIIATKDWHPEGHVSFASAHPGKEVYDVITTKYGKQTLWPDHCIQREKGSGFVRGLEISNIEKTFYKGENKKVEAYSALKSADGKEYEELVNYITLNEFDSIEVTGIALDYCVQETIKDLLRINNNIILDKKLTTSINKEETSLILKELKKLGVKIK